MTEIKIRIVIYEVDEVKIFFLYKLLLFIKYFYKMKI